MKFAIFSLFFVLFSAVVAAHVGELSDPLEQKIDSLEASSVYIVIAATVIIGVLTVLSIYIKKKSEALKWVLFLGFVIPSIIATVFMAGVTIFTNTISETNGPIHWHADFEIWKCGEKINLEDPTGLLNRIGSPDFHEHNDDRIHVEGTVVKLSQIDLHNFFKIIGGQLTQDYAAIPTNNGILEMGNHMQCDGKDAKLQVFVYRVTNPSYHKSGFKYTQFKLEEFEDFVMAPYSSVPPGDCIIVEFDEEKDQTDRICSSYTLAEKLGKLSRE